MSGAAGDAAIAPSERRPPPFFALLAVLVAGALAWIAPRLLYPDLNFHYPFVDGDSHDWIASGLHWAGLPVRPSYRPPLVPLALAALERGHVLSWFPLLNVALAGSTVLGFYRLAARLTAPAPAFAAALLLLVDYSLGSLALDVMADIAASCLLCWSLLWLVRAAEEPRFFLAAGLLAGLSSLAQPAALAAIGGAGAVLLLRRSRALREPSLWWGALLAVLPFLLWEAFSFGLPKPHTFRLVHAQLGGLPFYAWAAVSVLGVPACALLPLGVVASLRRRSLVHLEVLGAGAAVLAFFACAYDFNAKRFLLYALWPLGVALAAALDWLGKRSPAVAVAAAVIAIATAALPLPEAGREAQWAAAWPLPPTIVGVALVPGRVGRFTPDLSTLHVLPAGWGALASWSVPARVAAARAAPIAPLAPRSRFAADRGAVFLARDAADGGGRYRVLTRLGNALGRRVQCVPFSFFAARLPALPLEVAGRLGEDYVVARTRLPGVDGSWLLVVSGGVRLPAPRPEARLPWPPPSLRRGMREAVAVRDALAAPSGRWSTPVALRVPERVVLLPPFAEDEPLPFVLPFVLDVGDLYVVEEQERGTVAALLAVPRARVERVGAVEIERVVFLDEPLAVVSVRRGSAGAVPRRP
jgi:hypothetical protein